MASVQVDNGNGMISKDQLEKFFICGICREIYNEPVTLFCNHTFCQSCIISIKDDWDGRKCPLCQTKIWKPSLRMNNFVIRDLIKQIWGDEEYQKIYNERKKTILKVELKDEVVEEIKEEMWRSISDQLHAVHNPRSQNNNGGYVGPVCMEYNSLNGCLNDTDCKFRHTADAPTLMQNMKQLRREIGYLYPKDKLVCINYNTVQGCPDGEKCQHAHVPHIQTLQDEIKFVKENYGYLFTDKSICSEYNSLQGCTLGNNCSYVHIPEPKTLLREIEHVRKYYFYIRKDDLCFIIGFAIFAGLIYRKYLSK